jgi:pimeloyl-ACP methyl ester carboxylesterase
MSVEITTADGVRIHATHFVTTATSHTNPPNILFLGGIATSITIDLISLNILRTMGTVYTFDYRGHGKSGGVWPITNMDLIARDARDVLQHYMRTAMWKDNKIILIGVSIGTVVARLLYDINGFPRVSRILLFDPVTPLGFTGVVGGSAEYNLFDRDRLALLSEGLRFTRVRLSEEDDTALRLALRGHYDLVESVLRSASASPLLVIPREIPVMVIASTADTLVFPSKVCEEVIRADLHPDNAVHLTFGPHAFSSFHPRLATYRICKDFVNGEHVPRMSGLLPADGGGWSSPIPYPDGCTGALPPTRVGPGFNVAFPGWRDSRYGRFAAQTLMSISVVLSKWGVPEPVSNLLALSMSLLVPVKYPLSMGVLIASPVHVEVSVSAYKRTNLFAYVFIWSRYRGYRLIATGYKTYEGTAEPVRTAVALDWSVEKFSPSAQVYVGFRTRDPRYHDPSKVVAQTHVVLTGPVTIMAPKMTPQ